MNDHTANMDERPKSSESVNFTVRNRPKTPSEIVRNRPNRPKQASESSELPLGNSDGSLGIRTGTWKWESLSGGAPCLIDRMTADAQDIRDVFPHGTVAVDGSIYRIREDWTAVCDRAAAKFGAKVQEQRRQPLRSK
jgi:hypothetical protein